MGNVCYGDAPLVRCFADHASREIALYVHWGSAGTRETREVKRLAEICSPFEEKPPEFEWVASDANRGGPTLRLSDEAARELMNSLWDCGIRPVQGKGSAGQLEATCRHLEDMRHIAFGKLELGKP